MNILLDTHLVLWALSDDKRLSPAARELIIDERNALFYSIASMWEVSINHSIHPEIMTISGTEFMHYCEKAGYYRLSICDKHIISLETIQQKEGSLVHKDPFDRILLAQAKAENFIFLTHDSAFSSYDENCYILV
mgnify:FL=1|jgi:PIN domain nuclease of toxin-antitoxin system